MVPSSSGPPGWQGPLHQSLEQIRWPRC